MKKLKFCILAIFFMLSVIPTQLKAAADSNPAATTVKSEIKSTESNLGNDGLSMIKTLDMSALTSTENRDILKEAGTLKNDQDEHGRRYRNRHQRRDVDVTVTSGNQMRNDGYYEGRHNHSGAYIGGGGLLVLILILVLIL